MGIWPFGPSMMWLSVFTPGSGAPVTRAIFSVVAARISSDVSAMGGGAPRAALARYWKRGSSVRPPWNTTPPPESARRIGVGNESSVRSVSFWKPTSAAMADASGLQARQGGQAAENHLHGEVRRGSGVDRPALQHQLAHLAGDGDAGGGQIVDVDVRATLALQHLRHRPLHLFEHRLHLRRLDANVRMGLGVRHARVGHRLLVHDEGVVGLDGAADEAGEVGRPLELRLQ